jgi:hypothetical protein
MPEGMPLIEPALWVVIAAEAGKVPLGLDPPDLGAYCRLSPPPQWRGGLVRRREGSHASREGGDTGSQLSSSSLGRPAICFPSPSKTRPGMADSG